MRRFGKGLIAVAALGLLIALTVRAEEKVELDKLPKPVLDAVKAKFPEAKLTGASKEMDGTKLIYEVAFTLKDHKYEAELNPDGTFVAIDKQLELKELPKAVAKALTDKYPKSKYDVIEEVVKNDKIEYYEIELTTETKKKMEVLIDPTGKITKEEEVKVEPKDAKKDTKDK